MAFAGFLKQSTSVTIPIGPFVDESDGKTPEESLTISQGDVRLSKNGGAFAQKNESSASSHMEAGNYGCVLDTTDTGTLGRLELRVVESGALPFAATFYVMPANVWDSLFGADKLEVDVFSMAADVLTASALASDAATEIANAVLTLLKGAGHYGTAQAGASSTITLASTASASDDKYNDGFVLIVSGTGAGQVRGISDYVGSTKVATVSPNWATAPDNTSGYLVTGQ